MRASETPPPADGGTSNDSSLSPTDRLVAHAEMLLADGGLAIAQSEASLKLSRELASANAAADVREPFTRLCMALAKEMEQVAFVPTVDQVKVWRDRLILAAIATTNAKVTKGS